MWRAQVILLSFILFLSFISQTLTSQVYIATNGVNTPQCGSELSPCATLDYIFTEDDEDQEVKFNLTNSVVNVHEGEYTTKEIRVKFDNVTLKAVGGVTIILENKGFEIEATNFTIDGFRFTKSVYNTVPAYVLQFENEFQQNSHLTINNCQFANITVIGLLSASFDNQNNNGSLFFHNNRISNVKAETLLRVKYWNVDIRNVTVQNTELNDEAFNIEQKFQTLSVNNLSINDSSSKEIIKYEHKEQVSDLTLNHLSITDCIQSQNILTVNSNSHIINHFVASNLFINRTENVYFIFANSQYFTFATLNNISISHSFNPTSNVRLDAVFELPNGNFSISNLNFTDNTLIFAIIDIRSTDYASYYHLQNINIIDNVFDTNIYYYDLKFPSGGIIHLSAVKEGSISHLTAVNNKGIIQIIGITEATQLNITNAYFENNELTNGLSHDIAIKGIPFESPNGEVIIKNSTFVDNPPSISCYNSHDNNFKLTLSNNNFRNNTLPYFNSINTDVPGPCKVTCDTAEAICGKENEHNFWLWLLIAGVSVLFVLGLGLFVAWRLREKKRQEYETIE